ncbi:OmpA family protein [Fluviicola sp.]|uniref:OmpA family protein n=1 Tax=Fluviicola sp. TaxID=1917219 RepID=UPI0026107A16|nr:OmpA family protein [Fluviicola sp.]
MKTILHSLFFLLPILTYAQSESKPDSVSFYFELNRHEVKLQNKRNAKTTLKLSQFKSRKIILRAYTDTVGSLEYNLYLARQRLESVKNLIQQLYPDQFSIQEETAPGEDQRNLSDQNKRRVDIIGISTFTPTKNNITLGNRTVELGVPIKLEIIFLMGQDAMVPSSYDDIRFLIDALKNDNSLSVVLSGHVCCGTDSDNLSGKRANRIKQILVSEGGISGSRITALGFGNKKPLFVEDSEEHKQANRRVEATFYRK